MFEKHVLEWTKKRRSQLLEEFDLHSESCWSIVKELLPTHLDKVCGKGLYISLLLVSSTQHWNQEERVDSTTPALPSVDHIMKTVEEMPSCYWRKCMWNWTQHLWAANTQLWFNVWRYQFTALCFGDVYHRKPSTPPDSLVLRIINKKSFTSAATEWGIANELAAVNAYVQFMKSHGHDVVVCSSVFFIWPSHLFLGASPDGAAYDPTSTFQCYDFFRNQVPPQSLW